MRLKGLEQQHAIEKERSRIAQDMHDDLGANLTQIALLSELAQRQAQNPEQVRYQTGRIAETSRHLVQTLDEIVWAVNPRNDNLADFVSYVCQFAETFLESSAIRFRLERPATIANIPVTADLRHNLFLVVKEALNNIIKHAEATEVWLRVKLTDGTLEISLEDNGRGFCSGNADAFSDGLLNMRKRIESVGGEFETTSAPGAGTKIKCFIRWPK